MQISASISKELRDEVAKFQEKRKIRSFSEAVSVMLQEYVDSFKSVKKLKK